MTYIDVILHVAVTSRRIFVLVIITNLIFHLRMLYSIKFIMYVNSSIEYFFLLLLLGLTSEHG